MEININVVRTYGKKMETAVKATIFESVSVRSNRFLAITIDVRRLTVELSIMSSPFCHLLFIRLIFYRYLIVFIQYVIWCNILAKQKTPDNIITYPVQIF